MAECSTINPVVITTLQHGGVIAYPTEAVYGLGCDPDNQQAVNRLLAIKKRPQSKGLILIAADYQQLIPYIDDSQLSHEQKNRVLASWPGPNTWVFPASTHAKPWITGDFDTIAVRVSAHPIVQRLCHHFGKPLVSTSANLSGQPAINDFAVLTEQMHNHVDAIVPGETDRNLKPSKITDALTGVVYRN